MKLGRKRELVKELFKTTKVIGAGFFLDLLDMGDLSPPPPYGGTSVNGGTHQWRHRHYRGPNFDRLYHKTENTVIVIVVTVMLVILF